MAAEAVPTESREARAICAIPLARGLRSAVNCAITRPVPYPMENIGRTTQALGRTFFRPSLPDILRQVRN